MLGTILIADDNALVRESLCHVLRVRGYTVLEAEDGEQALKIADKTKLDLALIDIMMPTMGARITSGIERKKSLFANHTSDRTARNR